MGREELKRAIFDVIECLNDYPLSNSAMNLVVHYFNSSKNISAFEKALAAIDRYNPESMPEPEFRSRKLNYLLERLKHESDRWDME